jgi:hypothetical protein
MLKAKVKSEPGRALVARMPKWSAGRRAIESWTRVGFFARVLSHSRLQRIQVRHEIVARLLEFAELRAEGVQNARLLCIVPFDRIQLGLYLADLVLQIVDLSLLFFDCTILIAHLFPQIVDLRLQAPNSRILQNDRLGPGCAGSKNEETYQEGSRFP